MDKQNIDKMTTHRYMYKIKNKKDDTLLPKRSTDNAPIHKLAAA